MQFKGDQASGQSIGYREDGSKAALITYLNGVRHGQTYEYYSSGAISFEGNVINGEFEGVSKRYYENGKLLYVYSRHLGKAIGWDYTFNLKGDTIRKSYHKTTAALPIYYNGNGKQITADEWERLGRETLLNSMMR